MPGVAWYAEYRQLVADHNALTEQHDKLKAAVAQFISCPFIKGENGLVLTMNWADVEALCDAYREACGYLCEVEHARA